MAKHDTDPVLQQLVHAVNESRQAGVPVTVSTHGTVLTGLLIAEETYFADLVEASPLLTALQPSSGLLGKEYAKEVSGESDYHVHLRATGEGTEACGGSAWPLLTAGSCGPRRTPITAKATRGHSHACSGSSRKTVGVGVSHGRSTSETRGDFHDDLLDRFTSYGQVTTRV